MGYENCHTIIIFVSFWQVYLVDVVSCVIILRLTFFSLLTKCGSDKMAADD